MNSTPNVFEFLSAMITPSVLISASGLLVLSTSNRLSRVVDRVRVLAAHVKDQETSVNFITDQLSRLSRRAILLRSALTSLYVAITLFVITSILLGFLSVLKWEYGWVPIVTALIGSISLLYGSVLLISEARHAIASTLQELQGIEETLKTQ